MTRIKLPARPAIYTKIALVLGVCFGLASAPLALAQDSPVVAADPNAVVATVNGEAITEADLAYVQEDIAAQLQGVPPEQLRAVLLAQMINLKLMSKAGLEANLADSDVFKKRVAYLTMRALSRAYVQDKIASMVDDAAIQAEYDRVIGSAPNEEVHALHILVTSEDDAKGIKAALDAGGDFAALAKDKSIDPSAKQNGGDLGFVPYWQVVKPFADAAFALKDGETSAPVQSQFGWHVIRVTERRPATKPTLDELRGQIAQQLYGEAYQKAFDALRSAATIAIPDAALKAQVEQQLVQ
ncbi:MAG: peptidylprolyl isomerase [Devosia sp.]